MEAPKGASNRQEILTEGKSAKPLDSAGCTKAKPLYSAGCTRAKRLKNRQPRKVKPQQRQYPKSVQAKRLKRGGTLRNILVVK